MVNHRAVVVAGFITSLSLGCVPQGERQDLRDGASNQPPSEEPILDDTADLPDPNAGDATQAQPKFIAIVTPPPIPLGLKSQAKAQATWQDDRVEDVTGKSTWESSDSGIVAVDANGQMTSAAVGTAQISAEFGNRRDTIDVSVIDAQIEALTIEPSEPKLVAGSGTVTLKAVATLSNGDKPDYTALVNWHSENLDRARVDLESTPPGLLLSGEAGEVVIRASLGGKTATVTATIEAPVAKLLSHACGKPVDAYPGCLAPEIRQCPDDEAAADRPLFVGQPQFKHFDALAYLSNCTWQDVTDQTVFSSSSTAVAAFETGANSSRLRLKTAGATTISATYTVNGNELSWQTNDQIDLDIAERVLTALRRPDDMVPDDLQYCASDWPPGNPPTLGDGYVEFRINGLFNNCDRENYTDQVLWLSSDEAEAKFAADPAGRLEFIGSDTAVEVTAVIDSNGNGEADDGEVQHTFYQIVPPATE